jgi:asparagine synthase (glutamine-hydrolysing)
MSMAHGLEIRAPLLDHKLVELMFKVPSHLKRQQSKPKPLLIDSLPVKLPDEAVFRKKMGFTIPLEVWLKTYLKKEVESVLMSPVSQLEEFLSMSSIDKLWKGFLDGKVSWSRPWSIYVLKKWVVTNL